MNHFTMQVLRMPHDITGLAAALATRTAVAGAAQLSRLDTAYRIFASAVCHPQHHHRHPLPCAFRCWRFDDSMVP
jgi:hypothetical protein